MSATIDAYWRSLVTAALLGTDRRDPPEPPDGPIAAAVADTVSSDRGAALLAAVSVTTAARRAGFRPMPPAAPPQRPEGDPRPLCPPVAVSTWRQIVADWPVLEDEWLLVLSAEGWRLPPDVLAESLIRHRRDGDRVARVFAAGGPVAPWLVDQVPELRPVGGRLDTAAELLPQLPIPPDLAELLAVDAHTFVRRLMAGFETGEYGAAHRAVLVNLFARCRPAVLHDAADALASAGSGVAFALVDLARLRHRMLDELRRP